MLNVVVSVVVGCGFGNFVVCQGSVDWLDFFDVSFDLICMCFLVYYWCQLLQVLNEVFCVFKLGGCFIVIDIVVLVDVLVDIYVQVIELLCDILYVCNVSLNFWCKLLCGVGFVIVSDKIWKLCLEFDFWVVWMCIL